MESQSTNDEPQTVKRSGNPAWTPGCPSPNPYGRPRGIVDKRMRISQALADSAPAVAQAAIDAALSGDVAAMGIVLSRVTPALRATAERVQFSFDAKAPLAQQIESVLQAIADGNLPVDTGNQIIAAINVLAGVRNVEAFSEALQNAERKARHGGVLHARPNSD